MSNQEQKILYTLGTWTVKPGKEKEFIQAWTSFANWTTHHVAGSGKGYLLQDEKDGLKFVSFGAWADEISIERWRGTKEFQDFAAQVKLLCDDFQPKTMALVSTSD